MDQPAQPSRRAPPLASAGVLSSGLVGPVPFWVTKDLVAVSVPGWAQSRLVFAGGSGEGGVGSNCLLGVDFLLGGWKYFGSSKGDSCTL